MDPVDGSAHAIRVIALLSMLGFVPLCLSLVGAEDASGPTGDTEQEAQDRDLGDALKLSTRGDTKNEDESKLSLPLSSPTCALR